MKKKKEKTNSSGRMNEKERKQILERFNKELSMWSFQDQCKYEFADNYVNSLFRYDNEDNYVIQLGPVDKRIFVLFIFSLLDNYDSVMH